MKEDLALNLLKWLICHKTNANQTKLTANTNQNVTAPRRSVRPQDGIIM